MNVIENLNYVVTVRSQSNWQIADKYFNTLEDATVYAKEVSKESKTAIILQFVGKVINGVTSVPFTNIERIVTFKSYE